MPIQKGMAFNEGALKAIVDALKRGREAEQLVDRLLDWAVANRQSLGKSSIDGKECRFVKCYTYDAHEFPGVLIDALKFMGEPVGGLKRAKE